MRFAGAILSALFLQPFQADGRIKNDTIYTTDGDRIILTYEISNSDNQTTIRFSGQRKKLARINAKYNKNLDKIAVMFFDRTGNYSHDVSITNMVPEAFMIPSGVKFQESQDGFYLVQAEPRLLFTVNKNTEINIPVYLAYKPKKGKYVLFSKSKDLRIPLSAKKGASVNKQNVRTVQQTITSTAELEADNTVAIKVLESVNIAKNLIAETTELPFSENLTDELNYLRQKRREITDNSLVAEIADVMDRYESKKQLLEEKSSAEQQAREQEEEKKAREEAQAVKAQTDSIAAAQQMAAEEEKKRNFWMVAGGVILAVLGFVGNQIFQSVRNKRNQMQMMDMQQNIANRAEAEAKRRAQNAIRSQRNRVVNEVRQKATDTIRKKTTININGKSKKASI